MPGAQAAAPILDAWAPQSPHADVDKAVRLHITPFNPALLKVYLASSVLPLARNISYHTVATFPEKGFGYVELPAMEAQKLKKKLNGSTLKGSKVKISEARPEKRKVAEDADEEEPPKKRKKAKEQGVLEGVELPDDRKVKRGWTEPPAKNKKEKKSKDKDKDKKSKRKESKYTKEPELLFKTKLTPVAAAEEARKAKSKDKKKEKKEKNKAKREVVVHEFENNTKQPSFLKAAKASTAKKEAVEYVDGMGWVDEDGNVVEPEIGKVRNRRVLELVDAAPVQPTTEKPSVTPSPKSSPAPKAAKGKKKKQKSKKDTPPPSSESEAEESSVVSSSEDDSSAPEDEPAPKPSTSTSSPARPIRTLETTASTPPPPKQVHPLEALFKRPKPLTLSTPSSKETSTPAKGLPPINTSFTFFDNDASTDTTGAATAPDGAPITPYTQRDLEWRGLRSAAPTPDTAAINRRFSFPWRHGSQETDDADEERDAEADTQLESNTKANAKGERLPGVAEEEEGAEEMEADADAEAGAERDAGDADVGGEEEKPESEFKKWFWENQGGLNRAWKKRRREGLKARRLSENRKAGGGRRAR